jgi:hypothetical protein
MSFVTSRGLRWSRNTITGGGALARRTAAPILDP